MWLDEHETFGGQRAKVRYAQQDWREPPESASPNAREPRTLFLARRVQLIDRTQVPAAAIGEVLEEEVVFRLGKTAIASAAEPRVIAQK